MESYWICPLLVLRQYRSRQFISAMQRLAQCEFAYNELERSLHQYRSRNSAIELKGNLNKIEELKRKIEELETAL
ncbi:hypothetical protein Goklo_016410 [Gossypium klotzschianum]|uniref:Uncharacterized protein n=1 Tax=Gossypium klotzschianum TaxID=34286 RepID=A0A7J8UE94_9ROSI|nr:hypothetical protein [Gossypium klotzschianum]